MYIKRGNLYLVHVTDTSLCWTTYKWHGREFISRSHALSVVRELQQKHGETKLEIEP